MTGGWLGNTGIKQRWYLWLGLLQLSAESSLGVAGQLSICLGYLKEPWEKLPVFKFQPCQLSFQWEFNPWHFVDCWPSKVFSHSCIYFFMGHTYVYWVPTACHPAYLYCHPAYLTYMQSTPWETLGWLKHKLESRLPGEISITSDMQMTPPLWQKVKKN